MPSAMLSMGRTQRQPTRSEVMVRLAELWQKRNGERNLAQDVTPNP